MVSKGAFVGLGQSLLETPQGKLKNIEGDILSGIGINPAKRIVDVVNKLLQKDQQKSQHKQEEH